VELTYICKGLGSKEGGGYLLKEGLLARDYGMCVHARGHNANLTYCVEMELAQAK